MAKKGNPKVLRLVVRFLRSLTGMIQADFGRAARVDQGNLSDYELGHAASPEDALRRMAAVAGMPWPVVVQLRRFYTAALSLLGRAGAAGPLAEAEAAPIEEVILDSVLLAVTPYLVETWVEEQTTAEEELREADEIWQALETFPPARRRRLIELSPRPEGNVALARRICEASARKAADSIAEARELADLALFVARRVPDEGRRKRAEGFCLAFLANVLRVATDFAAADAELKAAWALWRAGEPAEPELLPEWRLHDLEASLRRAQQRFPAALQCLDRARALCGGEPVATGHILLKKEHLFHAMGDTRGALAALEEAAPFVEAAGDRQQLFALRFNLADNLCTLERYAEAAERLPRVREMALAPGRELDQIRVAWLAAKVAAGQGRREEALAGLDQVIRDFNRLDLPYEAALAGLDLAVLYLKEGQTAEVQRLAVAMRGIFEAKGIAREALAALALFCEAARQETATVELAKRVIAEVETAQRSASAA
jgi:tetratricopeptide (TPR) repeat protein